MTKQPDNPRTAKDAVANEIIAAVSALPERNRQEVLGYIRAVRDMFATPQTRAEPPG